jgi:hypothetical protein
VLTHHPGMTMTGLFDRLYQPPPHAIVRANRAAPYVCGRLLFSSYLLCFQHFLCNPH